MDMKKYSNKEKIKNAAARVHSRCKVVFCVLSFLPCFCTFSGPSLIEVTFAETFPPAFVLYSGVSKPTSKSNSLHDIIFSDDVAFEH